MRTDAQQRRLGLQCRNCVEQRSTAPLLAKPRVNVRQEPTDPFYRKCGSVLQPGSCALRCQLFRPVEVSGREVCRVSGGVSVSPVLPVSCGYSRKHRILQVVAPKTIPRSEGKAVRVVERRAS